MEKHRKTKPQLPPERVRKYTIPCKGNLLEFNKIKELAAETELSMNSYVLARALNYRPKARLTEQEKALLQPLHYHLNDYNQFVNNLSRLNPVERTKMLNRFSFMIEWLERLKNTTEEIKRYIDSVKRPNRFTNLASSNDKKG